MRGPFIAVLAALALGLGACGGDDDGGEPSKADFIEQADAICVRVNETIGGINDELRSVTGSTKEKLAKLEPILRRAVRLQEDAIEEFAALEPPPEDQDLIDRYLDAAEEQSDVLRDMAKTAGSGDAREYASVARKLPELSHQRRELIADYGFEQCGGGASS